MTIGCNHTRHLMRTTSAEDLALLKAQLHQALAQVDVQERAVEESLRPQTLADVELLEKKLIEALEELRTRKEDLQRKVEQPDQKVSGQEAVGKPTEGRPRKRRRREEPPVQ